MLCQVLWKSDNLGDLKCFLKDFDKIQNGLKSNMEQMTNDNELIWIQGFQRYLISEIWTNGPKIWAKMHFCHI